MTIQQMINQLLSAYVALGDSVNLGKLLMQGFLPDSNVDLITQAAGIGETGSGREVVLQVLLNYLAPVI